MHFLTIKTNKQTVAQKEIMNNVKTLKKHPYKIRDIGDIGERILYGLL